MIIKELKNELLNKIDPKASACKLIDIRRKFGIPELGVEI